MESYITYIYLIKIKFWILSEHLYSQFVIDFYSTFILYVKNRNIWYIMQKAWKYKDEREREREILNQWFYILNSSNIFKRKWCLLRHWLPVIHVIES